MEITTASIKEESLPEKKKERQKRKRGL